MLFMELGIQLHQAPTLWCDNVSALALASNSIYHAHTKHIEVDYHFIWENVVNGDILLKFISTLDQIADIFTKGLSSARFAKLKSKLMVTVLPIRLWGDVSVHTSSELNMESLPHAAPPNKASLTCAASHAWNPRINPLQQQSCQPCITLITTAYILQERKASQQHKESSAVVIPNLNAT